MASKVVVVVDNSNVFIEGQRKFGSGEFKEGVMRYAALTHPTRSAIALMNRRISFN